MIAYLDFLGLGEIVAQEGARAVHLVGVRQRHVDLKAVTEFGLEVLRGTCGTKRGRGAQPRKEGRKNNLENRGNKRKKKQGE